MKKSVTVKTVRILASLVLEIGWSTGETLRLDMSACTAPPFDALADPDFFARVELEPWGGHGLDWPNGLSMDADRLDRKSVV